MLIDELGYLFVGIAKTYMREEIETDYFTGWSQNMIAKDSFFVKTTDCLEKVRYADVL